MFEKDLTVGTLLDFYGEVLSEHARSIMECYYCDDLSLGEIAENEGISRQGVRHIIKKAEADLRFLEEKLGLAARFARLREAAGALQNLARDMQQSGTAETQVFSERLQACLDTILKNA